MGSRRHAWGSTGTQEDRGNLGKPETHTPSLTEEEVPSLEILLLSEAGARKRGSFLQAGAMAPGSTSWGLVGGGGGGVPPSWLVLEESRNTAQLKASEMFAMSNLQEMEAVDDHEILAGVVSQDCFCFFTRLQKS